MIDESFRALVVEETGENTFTRSIQQKRISQLPEGEVLIRVHYSALNYKDALSATGNKGVTKLYPHTPGIDAAGIVAYSEDPDFKPGSKVVVTSYDLGMNTSGGLGEYIRVPADWVVKLPHGLDLKEAMIIGTAGITAAMAVDKIYPKVSPEQGEVLVTGATGGLGSFSVALLARLGYLVGAVTGKKGQEEYLEMLGAQRIIPRKSMEEEKPGPMLKGLWASVIDTIGGNVLSNAIKGTSARGVVAVCGNAASPRLNITVYPLILRGITLTGIDSQNYPIEERRILWQRLASDWKPSQILDFYSEITLGEVDAQITQMLNGQSKGRIVVNMQE